MTRFSSLIDVGAKECVCVGAYACVGVFVGACVGVFVSARRREFVYNCEFVGACVGVRMRACVCTQNSITCD